MFSLDVTNHPKTRTCHGVFVLCNAVVVEARALQHEIDHCNGKVFLDRVAGAHAVYPRKTYQ